jgi:hypothetical protein
MKLKLPRRRWWWIMLSVAAVAVIAVIMGKSMLWSEDTSSASVEKLIHPGMTYRQVNVTMHKFGWSVMYSGEEKAESPTWQDGQGHSIWVTFDQADRVIDRGLNRPAR